MRVQDVRGDRPLLAPPCQYHQNESTGTHILGMPHQVPVFLVVASRANQRSLELCEESMVNTFGIQPLRTRLTMQKVDVLPGEAGLKQRIDGGMGGGRIGDGAHDAIHRIRDKVPSFCRVGFHDVSPTRVVVIVCGVAPPSRCHDATHLLAVSGRRDSKAAPVPEECGDGLCLKAIIE